MRTMYDESWKYVSGGHLFTATRTNWDWKASTRQFSHLFFWFLSYFFQRTDNDRQEIAKFARVPRPISSRREEGLTFHSLCDAISDDAVELRWLLGLNYLSIRHEWNRSRCIKQFGVRICSSVDICISGQSCEQLLGFITFSLSLTLNLLFCFFPNERNWSAFLSIYVPEHELTKL